MSHTPTALPPRLAKTHSAWSATAPTILRPVVAFVSDNPNYFTPCGGVGPRYCWLSLGGLADGLCHLPQLPLHVSLVHV